MKRSPLLLVVLCGSLAAVLSAQTTPSQQARPVAVAANHNGTATLDGTETSALQVRITSPLGRTGTPGTVRIVAQVHAVAGLGPVRFFVDGTPVGTVESGPPYAVPWNDDNPFERHEISVLVNDLEGRTAEDKVVLDPYTVAETAGVASVLVEASVYDESGRYVRDLDASRFSVSEDGVAQKLDLVKQEVIPATFALLIDGSQSMAQRMPYVRDAATRIVSYLKPADRVIVVPFGVTLRAITGPTDDRTTISDAIGGIQGSGGTSILDAVVDSGRLLAGIPGRKAIVLITDGYDENSTMTPGQAIAAMKAAGTTVYAIGIGGVSGISLNGEAFLRDLAAVTGGRAFFPPTEQALADVYDRLATDAQNRYLITYTPANQKADGKWREITVKTAGGGQVVQARKGYQAPKPAPIRPSLEFAVTDLQHHYVDVTRDDLVVREDGAEQTIETFEEAISPVSIVLALDESGSMKKSAEAVRQAALDFVRALRPEDQLAVIIFGDKSTLAHAFATNRDWSIEAIQQYNPKGGTALYDALWDSFQYLKTVKSRRAVVVLTDGRDEDYAGKAAGSVHTYEEVLNLLREAEVTAFPVGLGTKIDAGRLKQLGQVSGGAAYFPSDVAQLPDQYANIIENLRRRFVLGYTSTHTDHDGSWRNVEIRSRHSDLLISARSGYFAPDR